MQLLTDLMLKFDGPDWSKNPELGLIDTILEQHPVLIELLAKDISRGSKKSDFGRKDTPIIEQVIRTAIYKVIKSLTYRIWSITRLTPGYVPPLSK